MTELVLADRGERQVLLEERRDADPLGVALTHQMLVVGDASSTARSAGPSVVTVPSSSRLGPSGAPPLGDQRPSL